MSDPSNQSKQCPQCGSSDIRERRETGGGWRKVYRCADCGARVDDD